MRAAQLCSKHLRRYASQVKAQRVKCIQSWIRPCIRKQAYAGCYFMCCFERPLRSKGALNYAALGMERCLLVAK